MNIFTLALIIILVLELYLYYRKRTSRYNNFDDDDNTEQGRRHRKNYNPEREAALIRQNYIQTNVLTQTELRYYKCLRQELADYNIEIHYKVRLADIFKVKNHNKYYNSNFAKIMAKHVDFLIVDPDTSRPIIAIELDDSSHGEESSFKNDNFKNIIFSSSNIMLYRANVKEQYDFSDIKFALFDHVKTN